MASLMDTRRRILLNTPHLETLTDSLVSFDTDVPADLKEHKLYIEPIQDLHGYDHPWPAGGGKNVLSLTVDRLKSINPVGTWNGNTYTLNGVSFAVDTDSGGNVISITANGTATDISYFILDNDFDSTKYESYLISGLPSYGSSNTFLYRVATQNSWESLDSYLPNGSSQIVNRGNNLRLAIRISKAYTPQNLVFKPMIRKSTESSSYAPYSNICPISGRTSVEVVRCGKNLIDTVGRPIVTTVSVVNAIFANNCTVIKAGDALVCTGIRDWAKVRYAFDPSFFKPGKTYTVSAHLDNPNGLKVGMCLRKNRSWSNVITSSNAIVDVNITCTVTDDDSLTEIALIINDTGTSVSGTVTINNIQLEIGSTPTPYEPYQAETYDITFPSEAGTVYGGTLDVKSGVLTVDRAIVDLGSVEWYKSTGQSASNVRFYSKNINSFVKPVLNNNTIPNMLCSSYKVGTANYGYNASVYPCYTLDVNNNINIYDNTYKDLNVTEFKSAMSGIQLCYELATPIIYQLTPHTLKSLRGVNNLWSDTSVDTQVRFWTHKKED